jgi:hypothetical protein
MKRTKNEGSKMYDNGTTRIEGRIISKTRRGKYDQLPRNFYRNEKSFSLLNLLIDIYLF